MSALLLVAGGQVAGQGDPLPSWNDGAAVYHLGHFGTAAKKLYEFELKP